MEKYIFHRLEPAPAVNFRHIEDAAVICETCS
jgi:hypothetical protein